MSEKIQAIRFKQWLPEWDDFDFDESQHRRKPEEHILLFSMPAKQLRALSGVYRRTREHEGAEGLQRLHDPKRSAAIRDFVRFGHPYSSLPMASRDDTSAAMRKPGWLPTAIVVNILTKDSERRGRKVAQNDLVEVTHAGDARTELTLPYKDAMEPWTPTALEPLEVIDGQHRLWAFDEALADGSLPGDFELPVVAFVDLDIGWQAYLFWSINVSPKRINPSHAFDLFPLLRSAEWLETLSDLRVYRQARAQELTEFLYNHPDSPFYHRINMLGESAKTAPRGAGVTQAGWIQSITTSYLSTGSGRSSPGLFAADINSTTGPLPWSRPQQAAFLIVLWNSIQTAVYTMKLDWVAQLSEPDAQRTLDHSPELAFTGNQTMLNQEQGVRGILAVSNEVFFHLAKNNEDIFNIETKIIAGSATTISEISIGIEEIEGTDLKNIVDSFAVAIVEFDWRSADAPNLDDELRLRKRAFRGSSGYVALREQLFLHLANASDSRISSIAKTLVKRS